MNHNNFFEFINQIYLAPDIKNILKRLQDRLGMNTNVLLFCCWFAYKGCRYFSKKDMQNILNTISPWHNQIVEELNKTKVVIDKVAKYESNDILAKDLFAEFEDKQVGVKQKIDTVILDAMYLANQIEQTILIETIDRLSIDRTSTQKVVDACKSISVYSKELKGGIDQEDAEAIKQLLIYIFPDTDSTNLTSYWGNSSLNKRRYAFSHLQLPLNEL